METTITPATTKIKKLAPPFESVGKYFKVKEYITWDDYEKLCRFSETIKKPVSIALEFAIFKHKRGEAGATAAEHSTGDKIIIYVRKKTAAEIERLRAYYYGTTSEVIRYALKNMEEE